LGGVFLPFLAKFILNYFHKRLDKCHDMIYIRYRMNKEIKINQEKERRLLRLQLKERMKIRRKKEDERRKEYYR